MSRFISGSILCFNSCWTVASSARSSRQFDGKKCPDHFKPALFMTVRREIAEPRRETGARSRDQLLVQYVRVRGEPAGRRLVVAADRRLQQKCS